MNTFEDETDETETIGVSAHNWWMTPAEMNHWYSQGKLTAQPVSGDSTVTEEVN